MATSTGTGVGVGVAVAVGVGVGLAVTTGDDVDRTTAGDAVAERVAAVSVSRVSSS